MRHHSKIAKKMKQKSPNSNVCCRYVGDDVGIVRRAPQGVMLAVLSQFLKSLRDKKHRKFRCFWRLTYRPTTMVLLFLLLLFLLLLVQTKTGALRIRYPSFLEFAWGPLRTSLEFCTVFKKKNWCRLLVLFFWLCKSLLGPFLDLFGAEILQKGVQQVRFVSRSLFAWSSMIQPFTF